MSASSFSNQNNGKIRQTSNRLLARAVGQEIRALRRDRRLTIAELAQRVGLSTSLISRIEHGYVAPSLATLQLLADALSSSVVSFFQRYDKKCDAHFVKSAGDSKGEPTIELPGLSVLNLSRVDSHKPGATIEALLVTLTRVQLQPALEFQPGFKLIYMIAGSITYRQGNNIFPLCKGDSLMFDSDEPHGPEGLTGSVASYLSYAASSL